MKRKIIGNQRRLSTGVISYISCWFRHQQCRDIQRNMSLETKTKTRKTIKKTKLGKFNSGVKNHCCATSASKQATKLLADIQLTGDKQRS